MPHKNDAPPKFFSRLFKWFCKEEYFLELQGDLQEEFSENLSEHGYPIAARLYKKEVLKMIRPSVLKKVKLSNNQNFSAMFRINAKLALRNLFKHKLYTFINVGGLAISLAVCMLILLYVQSETSYDNYHPNKDRLYRVALDRFYPDHTSHYAVTPYSMAEQAAIDFPEVEAFCRIFPGFGINVTYENETFLENDLRAADKNFFDLFGIKLLSGSKSELFNVQNAVILSESTALKYFGQDEAVGKILKSDLGDLIVTGIAEDTPENTHFEFDLLINLELLTFLQANFVNFSVHNYLLLKEGVDPELINKKYVDLVEQYAAGQIERNQKISFEEFKASGNGYNYFLQPVTDIHLKSQLEAEFEANGNITYIYIFLSIAVFIVALAAVNFINLATARSTERAKEVGIRKVLGSEKKQLISQFLIESIFVSLAGMLIAVGLVFLITPAFNGFTDKSILLSNFTTATNIGILTIFSLVLGGIAGIYPAFVLSSFQPVVVLKGKMIHSKNGAWIRNGLVVFQFFISIVLICSTLIVGQQMRYMQDRNLGFEKDNVLVIERAFSVPDMETFKTEVGKIPGVNGMGAASAMPGTGNYFGASFRLQGVNESIALNCVVFADDFQETMQMDVLAGRSFSKEFQDTLSLMLNESAVRALGIQGDPVGQSVVNVQGGNNPGGDVVYQVAGVVKDYNYKSLHTEITPMAIFSAESAFGGNVGNLALKIDPNQAASIVESIREIWREQAPNQTYVYSFLDDSLLELYEAEKKSGDLFLVFTGIAIWIACIGLFGLATFIIGSRIKEIGVRKVLGATSARVVFLLMSDFNKLIFIAVLLAIPAAIWVMGQWLEGFAYRINMIDTWISFVIGGVVSLAVAWLTVSYHSIKAAMSNPVKNLRTE
ncbi:ABC transporter permease [Roseivirga sp. E12]|uniref:ABC transporter permease n=1 Tax=Roseivirga sp. E12 TaxID=2819237 RepID=UPI001ABCA9FB|nr:ABC transporter permease [Roseivirga sp. E12]MBO3700126.1 ABC transporter permease [Roseivirga sp. E12]